MELYSAAAGKGWGSCSSEGVGQAEERAASEIEVWVTLDHGRQTLEKHDKIHKCHTHHSIHRCMLVRIYRLHPAQSTEVHLTFASLHAYSRICRLRKHTIASLCTP